METVETTVAVELRDLPNLAQFPFQQSFADPCAAAFASFNPARSFYCARHDDPLAATTTGVLVFGAEADARECARWLLRTPVHVGPGHGDEHQCRSLRILRRVPASPEVLQLHLKELQKRDEQMAEWQRGAAEAEPPAGRPRPADEAAGRAWRAGGGAERPREPGHRSQPTSPREGFIPPAGHPPPSARSPDEGGAAARGNGGGAAAARRDGGHAKPAPPRAHKKSKRGPAGRAAPAPRPESPPPPPPPPPPAASEDVRPKARRQLADALRPPDAPPGAAAGARPPSPAAAERLAEAVEEALLRCHGACDAAYKAKLRSLAFNLSRNPELRRELEAGELSAAALVRLRPEELAPREVAEHRHRVGQRALAQAVLPTAVAAQFSTAAALELAREEQRQRARPGSAGAGERPPPDASPQGGGGGGGGGGGTTDLGLSDQQFRRLAQPLGRVQSAQRDHAPPQAAPAAAPAVVHDSPPASPLPPGAARSEYTVDVGDGGEGGEEGTSRKRAGSSEGARRGGGDKRARGGAPEWPRPSRAPSTQGLAAALGPAVWQGRLMWGGHRVTVQAVGAPPGSLPRVLPNVLPVQRFQPVHDALRSLAALKRRRGGLPHFWVVGASVPQAGAGGAGLSAGLAHLSHLGTPVQRETEGWEAGVHIGWELHFMPATPEACEAVGVSAAEARAAAAAAALLVVAVPCYWGQLLPKGSAEFQTVRVFASGPPHLWALPRKLDCRCKAHVSKMPELLQAWDSLFRHGAFLEAAPSEGDRAALRALCQDLLSDDVALVAQHGAPQGTEMVIGPEPSGKRLMLGMWTCAGRQVRDLWDGGAPLDAPARGGYVL